MYTILISDDNSLITTQRERIMQRSKLVENLQFLAPQFYKEHDMSEYTLLLEYVLPHSRKYCTEILDLSAEMYKDYLRYLLPVDTNLTSEAGEIEIQLTFVKTELDENGKGIQRVRKISSTTIDIIPIAAWSDIVPDSALSAFDQRLIKMDAQMRGIGEYLDVIDSSKVDNLVYDDVEETLQLSANGVGVGDKVSVRDMLDDGIPVVDMDSGSNNGSDKDDKDDCDCGCEDNVVEFGDNDAPEKTDENDEDVVEF